jgi:E3 ubiquitin-protein ligase UBR3
VQLQEMGQLVISGRVHDILRSVLFHATYSEDPSNSKAPQGLLFTALHLLALALDVCSAAQNKVEVSSPVVETSEPGASSIGLPSTGCRSSSPLLRGQSWNVQENPPLLVRAIERVCVQSADGMIMPERQSLLSVLVLVLCKFSKGSASHFVAGEAGSYNVADLITRLLGKFAQLSRECMYEIESLAPEIICMPLSSGTSMTGNSETKDQSSIMDMEKRQAIARERQAAVMVCFHFRR